MRKDKESAIKLRKQGKSYNEITKSLGIPKSTLSSWLKDLIISKQAQKRIGDRVNSTSIAALIKRNKLQTFLAQERAEKIRRESAFEARKFFNNPLFISGVSLYWAEGYKKGAEGSRWKSVDFANSDPEMIKVMMNFLRKFCGIDEKKIKIQLIAHPNINIDEAIDFWSKQTKVPPEQFTKTCCSISKYSQGKRDEKTLTKGTVHIRINDVKLFFRIIGWIDGLKNFLKTIK